MKKNIMIAAFAWVAGYSVYYSIMFFLAEQHSSHYLYRLKWLTVFHCSVAFRVISVLSKGVSV